MTERTKDYSVTGGSSVGTAPALVLIFEAGRMACRVLPMGARRSLTIGRDESNDVALSQDDRMSKRHARVTAIEGGFEIQDLDSRNGTFVNTEEVRVRERRLEVVAVEHHERPVRPSRAVI